MLNRLKSLTLIAILLACPLFGQPATQTYLVELTSDPLEKLARPELAGSPKAKLRMAEIQREKSAAARTLSSTGAQIRDTLDNVINGFIVTATSDQADRLRTLPGVRAVFRDCEVIPASDKAMEMNGIADAWSWLGTRDLAGEGIKIAFIDSGIVPDHPAFQDRTMRAPAGFPRSNTPQNLALTNGKIIVARHHAPLAQGREPLPSETILDTTGHGTALAAVAAGTPHQAPYGFLSGVAPKAWIGVYTAATGISIVKSLDAALEDGMDIANISFMFTNGPVEDVRSALRAAMNRANRAGLLIVMPTGPLGPVRSTLMDPSVSPDVITVGGTPNSRLYAGSVTYGSTTCQAFPGSNHWFAGSSANPDRVTAPAIDLSAIDATATGCQSLPAASLTGRIALVNFTGCAAEIKLRNLETAGAVAAIFYTANAATAPARFQSGAATLGGVVIGFNDATTLRTAIAQASIPVTVQFDGVPYSVPTNMVAPYSGRGPTFDHLIKPDLVAVGDPRYVAAQKTNPTGMLYSASGYATRFGNQTPSFATATVSGALAVLMSKRPGLTSDQYRSLIVNSATPVVVSEGSVTPVMEMGAGALDLLASLKNTVAVYPNSLSFGIAAQNVSQHRGLSVTNLGSAPETYTLRAVPFDAAPPLKIMPVPSMCALGDQACIDSGTATLTVTIEPGKTAAVYPRWHATGLQPGEYQGLILIEGTAGHGVTTVVPYWLGVPSGVPANVRSYVSAFLTDPMPFAEYYGAPAASATYPGTEGGLFYIVTDSVGIAITDPAELQFKGTAVSGGGRIGNPAPVAGSFGAVRVPVTLGPSPGLNTFQFQFGQVPAVTFSVTAVAKP